MFTCSIGSIRLLTFPAAFITDFTQSSDVTLPPVAELDRNTTHQTFSLLPSELSLLL